MQRRQIVFVQEEPRGPSELVEVTVERDGETRVPFPDQPQLRNNADYKVIIKGMRLIVPGVVNTGALKSGPIAPLTELQKMFLVLYCEGWEKGHLIPILTLNDVAGIANTPYRFAAMKFNDWENVDWAKSYIQYGNGTSSDLDGGDPYNVLLDVDYIRLIKVVNKQTGQEEYQEAYGPA